MHFCEAEYISILYSTIILHTCTCTLIINYRLLASAGHQSGTPVFFLADAPARYNA